MIIYQTTSVIPTAYDLELPLQAIAESLAHFSVICSCGARVRAPAAVDCDRHARHRRDGIGLAYLRSLRTPKFRFTLTSFPSGSAFSTVSMRGISFFHCSSTLRRRASISSTATRCPLVAAFRTTD
jgi:hypothetical protein